MIRPTKRRVKATEKIVLSIPKAVPRAPAVEETPGHRYRTASKIPGYTTKWGHLCDRCRLPLLPTDLVLPTADGRHWFHAACET